ncbi:MAG: pimeloyl-ACP methyl ester carboxylesterase [Verrucomicrobiales bacterium]|jgi:pimeloyl-ACP methyl ester carboxylesterase
MVISTVALALSACATVTAKMDSERVTHEGLRSATHLGQVADTSRAYLSKLSATSIGDLKSAKKNESKGLKVDAASDFLKAAVDAYEQLASASEASGSEAEKALIGIHNNSLARFTELWATDPRRMAPGPYLLTSGDETLEIALATDSTYGRYYFDRMVASDAVVEKGVVRRGRSGCGAAIVAIREQRPERAEEMKFFPARGLHLPVTITVDSVHKPSARSGGATRVVLSMRNPLLVETTRIGKRTFPLAADFSAPMAVLLSGFNQNRLSLQGFFKADERIKQSGIFLVEPYDPKRIPVILIHGLVSVPMIWRDIFPELASSPELANRYQFMVFTYPSSYPVAESALLLRQKLSELRADLDPDGNDPLSNNMVVVGHSMGGILTHTLVADIGDNLWKQLSDQPFDSIDIDQDVKELAREMLFFSPDPAVRRAIFISTPHRGAKMAEKGIPSMISRIARLPVNVLQSTAGFLTAIASLDADLKIDFGEGKKVTAIQSLEPGAPMVAALAASPFKTRVIYHSIIGDRDKGDTPNSSDGVVEYWSSHQDQAASELIVPTDHGAYKSPLAIEEIKRILRLHVGIR